MSGSVAALFAMDDEVAIVTGGSSGLGYAAAEAMASAGATVWILGRRADRLAEARDRLRGGGGRVESAVADVADREALDAVVDDIVRREGRLDVLVANAGIGAGAPYRAPEGKLAAYDPDTWRRVMDTNLDGVFHSMRAASRHLGEGGRILVTASTAGLRADPMVGYGYVAAKAAVLNLVKQAALEHAPRGIRVNALAPGPFKTLIGGRPMPPEHEAIWSATIPLGRVGEPPELAGAVLLLASRASGFITGATLAVDGGALALSHTEF